MNSFSSLLFTGLSLLIELQYNFFFFCGLKLDITSVDKIKVKVKSQSRFLYLRHSAIQFENWKMKNRFLIFNFPIKNGNGKLKKFYHFSIFNLELKIEICKNALLHFNFKLKNWLALSVHGLFLFDFHFHKKWKTKHSSLFVFHFNKKIEKWIT